MIKKWDLKWLLIAFVAITMPVIVFFLLLLSTGHGFHIGNIIPSVSDEYGWYMQIESFAKYGKIFGNYGYNGSAAQLAGTASWGIFPLIPYILVAKVVGANFSIMIVSNLFFLIIAVAVFIIFVKPDKSQLILICLIQPALFLVGLYSLSSMSECLRFALSIIIAGILIKSLRKEGNFAFKYIFVPAFLAFSVLCYLLNAIWIPVYIFLLLRMKKRWVKVIISLSVTMVCVPLLYYIVLLFSAPYFMPSAIDNLFHALKQGLGNGIQYYCKSFFANLYTMDIFTIIRDSSNDYGISSWFFISYIVSAVAILLQLFKIKEKNFELKLHLISLYAVVFFVFAYCSIYTGSRWTLARGICIGLIFSIFVMSISKNKKVIYLFITVAVFAMPSMYNMSRQSLDMRMKSDRSIEIIEENRKETEKILTLDKNGDRWENTIAVYGNAAPILLDLPSGFGINCMMSPTVICEAKWAAICKSGTVETQRKTSQKLMNSGYKLVYQNSKMNLFSR